MSKQINLLAEANKKSWARAKTLGELTGARPMEARSFLSVHPYHQRTLDTGTDKRNPNIRKLIKDYENWRLQTAQPPTAKQIQKARVTNQVKQITRPSKGDPSQPPRAGAPLETPTTADYPLLFELKTLLDKGYSTEDIIEGTTTLNKLRT